MLQVGSPFPSLSLPDQDGNLVDTGAFQGQKTVVYFYPKDDTPGCTAEACEFRDMMVANAGFRVVGVSPDPARSHRKFADKYNLPFTLLSDTDHRLAEAVGVWVEKSMYGKTYMGVARTTFVLDEKGVVEKVFENVKPKGHADSVLKSLA